MCSPVFSLNFCIYCFRYSIRSMKVAIYVPAWNFAGFPAEIEYIIHRAFALAMTRAPAINRILARDRERVRRELFKRREQRTRICRARRIKSETCDSTSIPAVNSYLKCQPRAAKVPGKEHRRGAIAARPHATHNWFVGAEREPRNQLTLR